MSPTPRTGRGYGLGAIRDHTCPSLGVSGILDAEHPRGTPEVGTFAPVPRPRASSGWRGSQGGLDDRSPCAAATVGDALAPPDTRGVQPGWTVVGSLLVFRRVDYYNADSASAAPPAIVWAALPP